MAMSGRELKKASEAFQDAFDLDAFDRMLRFHLSRKRERISLGGSFAVVVFEVLDAADREGWLPALVAGAREANPGNPQLAEFAEQLELTPVGREGRDTLERVLGTEPGYLDPAAWRTRLGALEGVVGRVEYPVGGFRATGTALLVGPDTAMTNYHVLEPVITGGVPPSAVVLRLDHRRSDDGTVLNPGTEYPLRGADWLLDASPPSTVDTALDPGGRLPTDDELDYAVFRLDPAPGTDPVAPDRAAPGAPARGWITGFAALPPPDSTLFLLQHPAERPLTLALGALLGVNANGTRVRHAVDTEGGSSGAPCFDRNLQLVALHHSGDPNFDPAHRPEYNEAVPLPAIHERLARRGAAAPVFPPDGHGSVP
ncbi:effector-associated domain EAD1-containing protein [Kitasatospora sp. NPDC059646]|uniref:effector-associated domain EAD1-containing protein n=1 Tax=Kitasatospora sp. NPDC059646 TaxID=3346893 RepID=UPI0036CE6435